MTEPLIATLVDEIDLGPADRAWRWQTAYRHVLRLARQAVAEAAQLLIPGEQKKSLVVGRIKAYLDAVVPLLPLPWWLRIIYPLAVLAVRAYTLLMADGLIEEAYAEFKQAQATEPPTWR